MKSLLLSFYFAIRGIVYVIRSQRNMKIHLFFACLTLIAGYYFRVTQIEWFFLIYSIFFVFVSEVLNTAVETTVDLVTRKKRVRAMLSKDIAAGAVLLAVLQALIIGSIIFYDRLLNCLVSLS